MFLPLIRRGTSNNNYFQKLIVFCNKCANNRSYYFHNKSLRGYNSLSQYIDNSNKCKNQNKFYHITIFRNNQIDSSNLSDKELNAVQFEKISNETLDSLTEYFDELIEKAEHLDDADVSYGDGVLTIKLGHQHGTYVINRQTPNKQIWLSSPTSGPKRYDFIDHTWIYKHDGKSMHELLDEEISSIVKGPTLFSNCTYSKRIK